MKKLFLLFSCMLGFSLVAVAYQTKGATRPNFSSSAAVENKTPVPGQEGVQTRTFSNYGSRQGAWRRGVTTKPVQTPEVKEVKKQEKEFAPIPQEPAPAPQQTSTKKSASKASSMPAARNFKAETAPAKKVEEPAQVPAQQPSAATPQGDPTAMM